MAYDAPRHRMKIVGYREIAPFVYEVVMESGANERITRKVLVLPSWAINPPGMQKDSVRED